MRGYPEESDEVKALRALREAACRYGAHYLVNFVADDDAVEASLAAAAVAYAATQPKPRKPRKSTPFTRPAGEP